MHGARAHRGVLPALLLLGCTTPLPPAAAPTQPPAPPEARREVVDRHGHTLAHLPPLPGDGACAPQVGIAARGASPQLGPGPVTTRIDGAFQAVAQASLLLGVERLARTQLPAERRGPPRVGEVRPGTVRRVVAEGLLLDVGAPEPALLPLPPPLACAGHAAALLPPPAARFRAGERLLVRVEADATPEAPARLRLALQGALVALDPQSRDVLALVGGYGADPGGEDLVTQRPRPAGALIHPLIYAAALASGRYSARSQVELGTLGGARGRLPLREALSQSSAPAAVRLLSDVGVDAVLRLAGRLGVPVAQLPRDLSLPQRSALTPWQAAALYATLGDSRAGRYAPPRLLRDDELEGRELPGAVSPAAAYQVSRLLHGALEAGAATAAQELEVPDLAGKDGTGQGGRDAWFAGYHGDLLCVVWVGHDGAGPTLRGADAALPIWLAFMRGAGALLQRAPQPLPRPPLLPPEADPDE